MMRRPPRRAGYFLRTRYRVEERHGERNAWGGPAELVELTRAELREVEARHGPALTRYRRIDAHEAHRWVKDGYMHHTGLYTDNGRIRYAEGEAC